MELIKNLDVFPFTKIFWKKKDDKILALIQRANRTVNLSEYETVKQKMRKAATYHMKPQGFEDEVEKVFNDNLIWLPIQRSKSYSGFSHKHFPTTKDDPQSIVYGVLSWKMEYAKEFKEASKNRCDHSKLAELLGYPKCCADFFNRIWTQGYYDPIWQSAVNTKGAKTNGNTVEIECNGYANSAMRYFGLRIVPQLTCSFNCSASAKQAKIFIDIMKEKDKEATEFLLDYLKGPFTWSVLHGIAQIETDDFIAITNSMPTKEKYTIEVRRGK